MVRLAKNTVEDSQNSSAAKNQRFYGMETETSEYLDVSRALGRWRYPSEPELIRTE